MNNAIQTARVVITPELADRLAVKYDDPHQAIIRPEVVMGVSRYFVERWVPVLGTSQATLVNTLRQLTYHNPKEPVTLSGEQLAQEAAMSRRHLYKCLKSPWVSIFVQVESGKKIKREGRTTRPPNRYTVRTEDPLTPADAQHLFDMLHKLADNPLEAMRQAWELPPRRLWANSPLTPPQTRFANPKPLFVSEVARRAFPQWKASDEEEHAFFEVLADLLHKHITLVRDDGRVSKVIVPQYFLQRWWSLLGHDLAWIYLWFRSRTYENPTTGAHRRTCWVPSLNTLLEVIGRPREWWRRNVERATRRAEGWMISEFFSQTEAKKGRNPQYPQQVARRFTVQFEIPVTPDNRAYYTDLLLCWPEPPETEEEPRISTTTAEIQASTLSREEQLDRITALAREDIARIFAKAAAAESSSKSEAAPVVTTPPAPPPPALVAAMREVMQAESAWQESDDFDPLQPTPPTREERLQAALTARLGHPPTRKITPIDKEGLPHTETINEAVTATSVHNSTPPSDTSAHKALPHPRTGSKHLNKALQEESHFNSSSSHPSDPPPPPAHDPLPENAAAQNKKGESKNSSISQVTLPELLERALRQTPELPLYKAAPPQIWLEQGTIEPIKQGTAGWRNTLFGRVPLRDIVALMLALWADSTILSPPRHFSWLTDQHVKTHGNPPATSWPQLRELAAMPIGKWPNEGHTLWLKINTHSIKRLPWGLEEIFHEAIHDGSIEHPLLQHSYTRWQLDYDPYAPDDGLSKMLGEGRFNAYGAWMVAMGHLEREVDPADYEWMAGSEPVYCVQNELFVSVKDQETADVLGGRLYEILEREVRGVAMASSLRVHFVLDSMSFDEVRELAEKVLQQKKAEDEESSSAPDSS